MNWERYEKNSTAFSREEMETIFKKKVCVVGCGGLGGYVIQILGRFGVGYLKIIDGDTFAPSNLNRQLFSYTSSLGQFKASYTKLAMKDVNPDVVIDEADILLTEANGEVLLDGMDLVIDCLDSIETRLLLQKLCEKLAIPMVHGAIGGFYGQVTTVYPGDRTLNYFYREDQKGVESYLGNPSFTPPVVASIQCSEGIKCLLGKGDLLRHKVLRIDLLNNEFEIVSFE